MISGISYAHPVSGAIRPLTAELLRAVYLVPRPSAPFDLRDALAADGTAPWSASLAVAPGETTAAVERALRELMLATRTLEPAEVDPSRLEAGSRARRHLEALLALWRSIGEALPDDLHAMRHVLRASAADALEPLPVLLAEGATLRPAERALVEHLIASHGAAPEAVAQAHAAAAAARQARAGAASLLGHVQRRLLDATVVRRARDGSLLVLGVRDDAMAADVAAGIAQGLLERHARLGPAGIGLLVPNDRTGAMHVAEAFGRAGLPLSGQTAPLDRKDLAGELLLHFLLARRSPAPAMALASLLASPLLPWPAEVGRELGRAIMAGDYQPRAAASLTGMARTIYGIIREEGDLRPKGLADELAVLENALPREPGLEPFVRRARELCGALRAVLATGTDAPEPPWERLLAIAAPEPPSASAALVRTTGGVTVLGADEDPWREVSQLLVLGYAEGAYPGRAAGNPLFLDSEIALIRESCGIAMRSQAEAMRERLDLFRRQIGIASESAVFLAPYRDLAGGRLAPASSLPLVARCIVGIDDPEDLILDLDTTGADGWPDIVPRAPAVADTAPAPPAAETPRIALGRDLLELRRREDGGIRPQSPSRLETLIVSPLAWLLKELDAAEEVWAPEAADALRKGSLAHEVFERLFLPGAPLPAPEEIRDRVPRLLAERIRRTAPFLQASAWWLERGTLADEITRAALAWRSALHDAGAAIVANEFWLGGEVFGVGIHGKIDCLLRLADGQLVIVDHKKSGTRNRQGRLRAGWDLQVELYRRMARGPAAARRDGAVDEVAALLAAAPGVGVAYHLMNDGGILVQGAALPAGQHVFTPVDDDISGAAIAKLLAEITALRRGQVTLNREGDRKFFKDTARMGLYAFDTSPLVGAFTVPAPTGPDGAADA